LVFFGTADFAVPSLRSVLGSEHEVAALVTQPDRPKGRSGHPQPPPTKPVAESAGLEVLQPEDCNEVAFLERIESLDADVALVAAYGQILRLRLRRLFRRGCWNVHASLLPRWRGAAPINWAIVKGDATSGVTVFRMTSGIDSGKMLVQAETAIAPEETAGELAERLSALGAQLALKALAEIETGAPKLMPQDEAKATLARTLSKSDGLLDWNAPAGRLHDVIRGLTPWPGAFGFLDMGKRKPVRLLIHRSRIAEKETGSCQCEPGVVCPDARNEEFRVATGNGVIILTEVQAAGARRMDAAQFLRGHRFEPGWRFAGTAE